MKPKDVLLDLRRNSQAWSILERSSSALLVEATQAGSFARCLKVSNGAPERALMMSGPRLLGFDLVVASQRQTFVVKPLNGIFRPSRSGGGPGAP